LCVDEKFVTLRNISSKMNASRNFVFSIGLAGLSGLATGLAFPPARWSWLVWVGLVPLLESITHPSRLRDVFWLGILAGYIFFLLTLYPLISADSWMGWAVEGSDQFWARLTRQWWMLRILWLSLALWGSLFWGLWALLVRMLSQAGRWYRVWLVPSLWILVPEWLRAQTTWGFQWAFLGNATADWPAIRQTAALGGTLFVSGFVVLVNVGVADGLQLWPKRLRWQSLLLVAAVMGLVVWWGSTPMRRLPSETRVRAAFIQQHQPVYQPGDFSAAGLDRTYLSGIQHALDQGAQLVVLPESIVFGSVSLDGTRSASQPQETLRQPDALIQQFQPLLTNLESTVVLGTNTVEHGQDYNSLIAWNGRGLVGWYHKRRLVPFAEYQPWKVPGLLRGASQYAQGQGSQLIRSGELVLGGLICQEVLFPSLARASVRDGATVLISAGNDGVFMNPAVAQVEADAARLLAVETGRYIIRAMKIGVSAIIDPTGRELAHSRFDEIALRVAEVAPQRALTAYVRFGDWIVWCALIVVLGCGFLQLRCGSRGPAPNRSAQR